MTQTARQGFGYVTTASVGEDDVISLSSDSNLSSTSLLKTLIEPSPSEELFFKEDRDDSEEEVYRQTRESVRVSMSYFRRDTKVDGLNIDYRQLRNRDVQRRFTMQSVPIQSLKSRKILLRKYSFGDTHEDGLIIPLMSRFGMRRKQSWKARPSGQVAELLNYMKSNPVPVSSQNRFMYIKMAKQQLEEEDNIRRERQSSETEEEREERVRRETDVKKREDEVLRTYSERERMVIKEALGRVPTLEHSLFIPLGKENILSKNEVDSEHFFTDEVSLIPSYDEYYSTPEDFGNISVRSTTDYR